MPLTITVLAGNRGCRPEDKESAEFEYPTFSEVREAFINDTPLVYFGTVEKYFKFAFDHANVVEQGKIRPKKDGSPAKPKRKTAFDLLVNS